jgi:hypothetical protein
MCGKDRRLMLAGRLFSGTSEMQKNIIAALLGTGEGYRGNS